MSAEKQVILLIYLPVTILSVLLSIVVYRAIFRYLHKKVKQSDSVTDDLLFDLFRIPVLLGILWIELKIFLEIFFYAINYTALLRHISSLFLIFVLAWISIQSVKMVVFYIQRKLNGNIKDNLSARRSLTQLKVFQSIINSLIILVAIAASLLTFREARTIGLSLLTSAGIIGIIVGFAAQKSLGMILSGIQLAITQPIRLDDVVIVEGEWGRIEEITLTYVVVKIWDERRMVLPVNYFLEKPFQNWTRNTSDITGSVFLYTDFNFPVESIRKVLPEMLKNCVDFDGRICNVQVTKITENSKEIRILLSSSDASKNWDLRALIREKLIDYINQQYPGAFSKMRIHAV